MDTNVGVPSVTVTPGGPNTAKTFAFEFKNLKGEKGDKGDKGDQGPAGADGAKGDKGDPGVGLTGEATALDAIAEPTTAEAAAVAAKVNEIITALKARGIVL